MRKIFCLFLLVVAWSWAEPIRAPGGPCQLDLPAGWKLEEGIYSYPELHLKVLFDARPMVGIEAEEAARHGALKLQEVHQELDPQFPAPVREKGPGLPVYRLEGTVQNSHGQQIHVQEFVTAQSDCVATVTFLVRADFEKSTREWRQKVWKSFRFLKS